MDQEIQFHTEEGISDDVSALSMDGASAIAGLQASGFAKRIRKNYSSGNFLSMDILEEDENDEVESQKRSRRAASHRQYEVEINNGEELLEPFPERVEPFPKTYEEWQEKKNKEKKEKRKHKKKHKHKKSSKAEGSRARSENDLDAVVIQQVPPPVMEISVGGDSNLYHSTGSVSSRRQHSHVSAEARSYTPSVASTQDESSSSYHHSGSRRTSVTLSSAGNISATSPNQRESSMSRVLRRQSEMRASVHSVDSRESSNRENSTHVTNASATSRSYLTHVSVEELEALHANLSSAKQEEEQVVDIHSRLEVEVDDAEEQSSRVKMQMANIEMELATANLEREQLQSQLKFIQDENTRLLRKLRNIEDEEQEERLDSLMNDMNYKMRALKLKSSRSRER